MSKSKQYEVIQEWAVSSERTKKNDASPADKGSKNDCTNRVWAFVLWTEEVWLWALRSLLGYFAPRHAPELFVTSSASSLHFAFQETVICPISVSHVQHHGSGRIRRLETADSSGFLLAVYGVERQLHEEVFSLERRVPSGLKISQVACCTTSYDLMQPRYGPLVSN